MIESIKNTTLYKSLQLDKNLHHAYLFYSLDKELNNNIALSFAKSLVCDSNTICNNCNGCKQFDKQSHPDVVLINQSSIKVEDANKIVDKLSTKPITNKYKVFIILNAENINEIAQNKLLKSLEEPNSSTIFILSTSKTDKLLATVLSRLHKINVPKLSLDDKLEISHELRSQGVDVTKYLKTSLTLTDIINFETNENYQQTIKEIKTVFTNLKTSQDIPSVSSSIVLQDKTLFLPILQNLFFACLNNESFFDAELYNLINQTIPKNALIKCLEHINNAYKKQMANVNFGYILDNLLFNILKEKFLCKQ